MGTDLLSIGSSGLFTAKKKLQTSGHNIANVNTEGYSRQRSLAAASSPIRIGPHIYGTGSYIKTTERVHNDFLEDRLNVNITANSFNQQRAELLGLVEEVFNEINYEGLDHSLSRFFNSFRDLSNDPSSETLRTVVRDQAKVLVNHFHKMTLDLNTFVKNIDQKMDESVSHINATLDNISKLNVKIKEIELGGGESGDLRDERDVALRDLAEYFEIDQFLDDKDQVVINAKGIGTLLNGSKVVHLQISSPPKKNSPFPTSKEVFFGDKSIGPIFQSGKMSALFQTRDRDVSELKNRLDEVAFQLTEQVNQIHRLGFANKKIPADFDQFEKEQPQLSPFTGIDFFKPLSGSSFASELIGLSQEIEDDVNTICTAIEPNKPGDNRLAIALSKLQDAPVTQSGTKSLEASYLEAVSSIGVASNKAILDAEQSEGILAQTKAMKERLTGVSIDEEMAEMVKNQHAFDASARVMKVADEMFKAVLGIKG